MNDTCNRLLRGHRKQSSETTASDCLEAQTRRESQNKQTKTKSKQNKTQNGQQRYNIWVITAQTKLLRSNNDAVGCYERL